jgi:hypothetical protein
VLSLEETLFLYWKLTNLRSDFLAGVFISRQIDRICAIIFIGFFISSKCRSESDNQATCQRSFSLLEISDADEQETLTVKQRENIYA